jgi:hypothetical protein
MYHASTLWMQRLSLSLSLFLDRCEDLQSCEVATLNPIFLEQASAFRGDVVQQVAFVCGSTHIDISVRVLLKTL